MNRRRFRHAFPWILLGILVLGVVLRVTFLTSRSLWFDEAFSWRLMEYFPSQEFFSRAAADVHPVLYYMLLWFWMLPLRSIHPETTLLGLRAFSVLFGALTIVTMMLAGRVMFRSRWVGVAAGLLTAVNAFQLQYAWEARMYTLGTALLPLALAALVRVADARTRGATWRAGVGMGLGLGALLHVHYYALFSWFALGVAKLAYFVTRMWSAAARAKPRTDPGSGAGRWGVWSVLRSPNFHAAEIGFWLSVLLFLPQLPTFLAQTQRVEESFWIPRLMEWSIPNTFARLFWGGTQDIPHVWAVLATGAAIFFVVVPLLRGRSFGDLLAAMSFVVPLALSVLASFRTSVFLDRYFLFASLGLLLLVARTFSFLPLRVRTIVLLCGVGVGLFSVMQFWQQLDFPAHPGARAAAVFITERADPRDPVLVSSSFAYFPLSFHLGCNSRGQQCSHERSVRLYSETGELAHFAGAPILFTGEVIGPEALTTHNSKSGTRMWVVDTTGFGGSFLELPLRFDLVAEKKFSELFPYQGDMIIREYVSR